MSLGFAKVYSAQSVFLRGHIIDIEADVTLGLHSFSIVGLPDKAVEEAKDRVGSAIKNSGFVSPKSKNQKLVISLAPAHIKKEGPTFDLGIALAYLLAVGDIYFNPHHTVFLGELSLDGSVRKIKGVLPLVLEAREKGFKRVFVPWSNYHEASLVSAITIVPIESLKEAIEILCYKKESRLPEAEKEVPARLESYVDFEDILGQESAKRALEIAAAGGHNIAMHGPPGTGKTMLAKAFRSVLPKINYEELLEVTAIYSVAGLLGEKLATELPFRAPHHTASYASMVGGGAVPKPGEVTLAHKGVLFLDEFPEFDRKVIDCLREPLEERVITISRARGSASFPADFILIAAMNECPCGNFNTDKECRCGPRLRSIYQQRISGPVADRIDMWVPVDRINPEKIKLAEKSGESSTVILERVARSREIQHNRFCRHPGTINGRMNQKLLKEFAFLTNEAQETLDKALLALGLSMRSYHKMIKLSRTIADLTNSKEVLKEHMLEALQYRRRNEL